MLKMVVVIRQQDANIASVNFGGINKNAEYEQLLLLSKGKQLPLLVNKKFALQPTQALFSLALISLNSNSEKM